MLHLTLYTRPGCHLCEEMKGTVERVSKGVPVSLEEVDISTDPALEDRYGLEIPVLLIEGTKVAKYRVSDAALRRALETRSDGSGRSGGSGK